MKTSLRKDYEILRTWLRELECELRAFACPALDSDITPMCPDDSARDGKPQACAARPTIAGFFAPIKTFENMGNILRVDALACVAHAHFHTLTVSPRMDLDLPARGC